VTTTNATGVPQIERVNLATHERRQITDVTGAAVAAEPNPSDAGVWFLSLYARGYDLRRLTWSASVPVATQIAATLTPAAAVPPDPVHSFATDIPSAPRPFGLAPRLFLWLPIPRTDADGVAGGLALTSRDLIGRSALMLQGAAGEPAEWRGASATGEWFGTRPAIRLDAFGASQRTSALANDVGGGAIRFDSRLVGGDAMLDGNLLYDSWALRYRVGGSAASLGLADPNAPIVPRVTTTQAIGFATASIAALQRGDGATLTESLNARGALGQAFDAPVRRIVVTGALSLSGRAAIPLAASATYGRTNVDAPVFEQLAIGGGPVPLIPADVMSQRLPMPVLPSAIMVGSSAFTYRASLQTQPLSLYLWGGSTARAGQSFSLWQRVAGIEWTQSVSAIPMAGTPAARALIGVGESLDAPLRHRVRVYAALVLDP
jgi:hypothetical protein